MNQNTGNERRTTGKLDAKKVKENEKEGKKINKKERIYER